MTVSLHRRVAWLALAAMGLLALVPTVSHALALQRAAQNGIAWTEVCTPQGMRLVAVDTADTSTDASAAVTAEAPVSTGGHLEHCSWCAPSLTPPLPTHPLVPALDAPTAPTLPAAFLHAPSTGHVWACANPRAPPRD